MLPTMKARLQDRRDAAADRGEDAGFTLIELMVVLLILAILLAIAIPTFLGVTGGANDKAAQANLNTALTTAKTAETQNGQAYNTTGGGSTNITTTLLQGNEPSLSFVTGSTTTQGVISVWIDNGGKGIILASPSKNKSGCWYAVDNVSYVTGGTANGLYIDTTASPGVGASTTTSAPTAAGTYYGYATGSACNAGATTIPAGIKWASSFTLA